MAALTSYSGVVYKVDGSGEPDPGVQVALYNESTGDKSGQEVSSLLGQYSFSGLLNGTYRVRYYGSYHNPVTESFIFTVYDPNQIVIPDTIALPLVKIDSGAILNVSESGDFLNGNINFSNPSVASISGSNIDVTQGVITQISISYRPKRESIAVIAADKFYDGISTSTSNQWIPLGIKNAVLEGNNQVFTMDLPGIPVSEEETLYYEFRAQFLNGDGIAGTFATGLTVATATTFTFTDKELTVTGAELSGIAVNLIGKKVQFISPVFQYEGVAYKTTGSGASTKLHYYFPANPQTTFGAASTVAMNDNLSDSIYDVSSSANTHGVDFNGLNDLIEKIEVKNLKGTIANSLYTLEWLNYKDITGIFSSGSGTTSDPSTVSLPYADGEERATTHLQLNAITSYQVYLFVSSDGQAPTYEYPIGYKDGALKTTGEDDHGQWYLAKEIAAPAIGYTEYPKIELLLPVPAGQQVAIWVGARTAITHGDTGASNNPFTDQGSALDGVPPLDAGDKGTTGDPPIIT